MASFRDSRTFRVGLEHTGVALRAAITPYFWHIFLLSLDTLCPCSLHGLSVSMCTSSPERCCVSRDCWKRNRNVLLGLHPLPSPQNIWTRPSCFSCWLKEAPKVAVLKSERAPKPFYLFAFGDPKRLWEELCCFMSPGELQPA